MIDNNRKIIIFKKINNTKTLNIILFDIINKTFILIYSMKCQENENEFFEILNIIYNPN